MKKVIIIHCWEGYPKYCWYPYVKHELEIRGYKVQVPYFPDTLPLLSKWIEKISKAVGTPDEQTILIGHSLGSVAVLKYLQSLSQGQKIAAAILVSGFINPLGIRPLYNFFREPWDFKRIKSRASEFVLIASDNDPYIRPFHAGVMRANLNARVIWKTGGHFTEYRKIQFKEFPEVVHAVEEIGKYEYDMVNHAQPITINVRV